MAIREILQFVMEADAKQAIGAFNNLEQASKKSLTAAETRTQKWSATLTKAGAAAIGFAGIAGVGMFKAAQAAGELDTSMRRVEGIFEDSAGEMKSFITGANRLGLSDRQAAKFAASIGNAGVATGITADAMARVTPPLIEVVTQLGMLQGMNADESLERVNSAIIGEYDGLQKLVGTVSAAAIEQQAMADSGEDNAKSLTQQQKTMALFNIILQDGQATLDRSGDAMDTLAGKTQIAKANLDDAVTAIGAGVLPAASSAAGAVADLAGKFSELPAPIQKTIGTMGGIGIAATAAIGAVSLVAGQFIKLQGAMKGFGASHQTFALIARDLSGIAAVAPIVGAAAIALGEYDKARQEARVGEIVSTEGVEQIRAFDEAVSAAARDTGRVEGVLSRTGHGWDNLGEAVENTTDKTKVSEDVFRDLVETQGVGIGAGQKYIDTLKEQGVNTEAYEKILEGETAAQLTAQDAAEESTKALDKNAGATKAAGDAAKEAAASEQELADATKQVDEALKSASAGLEAWNVNVDAGAAAADAYATSIERTTTLDDAIASAAALGSATTNFRENMKNLPADIDLAKLALGGYSEEQTTAIDSLTALSDETTNYVGSLLAQGASAETAKAQAQKLAESYAETMRAAGYTEAQIKRYQEVLGLTDPQIDTAIKLSGDAEAITRLELMQTVIAQLEEPHQIAIATMISHGDYAGALAYAQSQLDKRTLEIEVTARVTRVLAAPGVRNALGNPNFGSPRSMQQQQQLSAGLMAAPGTSSAGVGSTVNVYMPAGADGVEVIRALRRHERRNGPRLNGGWRPV